MNKFPFALMAASLLLGGCGEKAAGPTAGATNSTPSGSSPVSAPADYVGALGKAKQTAVKTADVSTLQRAIESFGADKGRNPKDLNELVEGKYLSRIPEAPYGMKIEYDAESGTVKVVKQ